jgi:transcriptional regulator with XRE-family HTH domain
VLGDLEVSAEVQRLGAELRAARETAGLSHRALAAAADVNQGTVFRVERGLTAAGYPTFSRLAEASGVRLELDDGRRRPRTLPSYAVPLSVPGAGLFPPMAGYGAPGYQQQTRLFYRLCAMGEELRWARQHEFAEPVTASEVCELLGFSHHTLRGVEDGPTSQTRPGPDGEDDRVLVGWPRLSALIRAAAVTGRRLVLVSESEPLREPPWPLATGGLDVIPPVMRLRDVPDGGP